MPKPKNRIRLDYLRACFDADLLPAAFVIALGLALFGNLVMPCFAQGLRMSTVGTTSVTDNCRHAGDPLEIECAGYILGVFDQIVLSGLICPRPNPTGLTAQAVAVALRFLNDHPEKWDQPPASLIGESFKAAFRCGG